MFDLSSSSESDWEGDFHGPSYVFYSMQPPDGPLATTKRIPNQKGSKQGRLKGPRERDRTQDRHKLEVRRITEGTKAKDGTLIKAGIKMRRVTDFFTAAPAGPPEENQKRPRATSSSCSALFFFLAITAS